MTEPADERGMVEQERSTARAAAPGSLAAEQSPLLKRGQSQIPSALQGTWSVVQQTTIGDGPQAYLDNDPALLGAKLRLTSGSAAWEGNSSITLTGSCEHAYFDFAEEGDQLSALRDELAAPLRAIGADVKGVRSLSFMCLSGAGEWGPQGTLDLLLLNDGRMALRWYDNLLLVLEKR